MGRSPNVLTSVEPGDERALRHAIAFGDFQLEHTPPNRRRHLHFGGFHLTRGAHAIGRRFLFTRREEEWGGEKEQPSGPE